MLSLSLSLSLQAVGCDNVLGSLKSLDKCHQCVSPDDSSCVEHSGMFMSNQPDTTGMYISQRMNNLEPVTHVSGSGGYCPLTYPQTNC